MKANVLFQRVPTWTYVLLFGVLTNGTPANGFFPANVGVAAWSIENPDDQAVYSATIVQVGSSGAAKEGGVSFTVEIKHADGSKQTVSSTGGTSTRSTGGNHYWSGVLPRPQGGFIPGNYQLVLSPTGVANPLKHDISFE